jgi:curved DNA-binding protein CbpA
VSLDSGGQAMKDLYEILDVLPDALPERIREQWRFLVHAWHPDKFPNAALRMKAEEQIKEINKAYEILSHPHRRAQYDKQRSSDQRRRAQAEPRPRSASEPDPIVDVCVFSIGGSVSRAGNRYRFQIRIEADNESTCALGWSGPTINVLTINSRDR